MRTATFSFLALLATVGASAQTPLAEGTYYIQNAQTGTFIASGDKWGTRAVLTAHGVDFKVTESGGKYTLGTRIKGNDTALRPSDGYMDQSGAWTITPLADGTYTMYNGSNYFGYDAGYERPWVIRLTATSSTAKGTHWRFLTRQDLTAQLAEATPEKPMDATFLIQAPDFLLGDYRVSESHVWGDDLTSTRGFDNGDNTVLNNSNAEQFDKAEYDVYQVLTDLPSGTYSLSVQGFYRYGTTEAAGTARKNGTEQLLAILYAGDKTVPLQSIYENAKTESSSTYNHASDAGYVTDSQKGAAMLFDSGLYVNRIDNIIVADGTLRIGIRKASKKVSQDWACFDNFTLTYHGLDMGTIKDAAVAMVQEYAGKNKRGDEIYAAELAELLERAANMQTEADLEALNADLKASYGRYLSRPEPTTKMIDLSELLKSSTMPDAPVEVHAGTGLPYGLKQSVTLAAGTYRVRTQGFYRYGTTYDADLRETGAPITQGWLCVAGQRVPMMRQGDADLTTYAYSLTEAVESFAGGEYRNAVCFTLDEPTTVEVGIEATFGNTSSWFVFSPIVLEKVTDALLAADATKTFEASKRKYIARWKGWSAIASQAVDATAYNDAVATATEAMNAAQTDEEVRAISATVRQALYTLIATQPSATGQYDITMLMSNATFDRNVFGWETTTPLEWQDAGVAQWSDTKTGEMWQTLVGMPAGTYTLKVQGFYRPTSSGTSARYYEDGVEYGSAYLFIDDEQADIKSIHDDARFYSARPSSDTFGAYDRAVPTSGTGAQAAFQKGDYWNIVRADHTQEGDLRIGIGLSDAHSQNWLAIDNFRLYYGARTLDVELSTDKEYTVTEDSYANVTTDRVLKAGQLNSICLPFDMEASEFKEIYSLAGFNYDTDSKQAKAIIVPAREVKAGQAYFVTVDQDKTITAHDVVLHAATPDSVPCMWEHATTSGTYGKLGMRRTFYLNSDGTAFEYRSSATKAPGMTATVTSDLPTGVKNVPVEVVDFQNVSFGINIENAQVRKYLKGVTYGTATSSTMKKYYQTPAPVRRDHPKTAVVPLPLNDEELTVTYGEAEDWSDATTFTTSEGALTADIRNLYPGRTYYYKVEDGHGVLTRGQFTTEGTLRMIKTRSGSNIRDLGGWLTTEGNRLNYGLIYRGGEMTAAHVMIQEDRDELRRLGIGAELDLRSDNELWGSSKTVSPLGDDVSFLYINQSGYEVEALQTVEWYNSSFNHILANLRAGRPLYFHCIWGADRTGAMGMVLEGLCGVKLDQLYKDYELTSFSIAGLREKPGIDKKLEYIRSFGGKKLQENFLLWWNTVIGVERDDLIEFIGRMGGDLEYLTGVEDVTGSAADGRTEYYGLDGIRRDVPTRGINIVRYPDGRVRKVRY